MLSNYPPVYQVMNLYLELMIISYHSPYLFHTTLN